MSTSRAIGPCIRVVISASEMFAMGRQEISASRKRTAFISAPFLAPMATLEPRTPVVLTGVTRSGIWVMETAEELPARTTLAPPRTERRIRRPVALTPTIEIVAGTTSSSFSAAYIRVLSLATRPLGTIEPARKPLEIAPRAPVVESLAQTSAAVTPVAHAVRELDAIRIKTALIIVSISLGTHGSALITFAGTRLVAPS